MLLNTFVFNIFLCMLLIIFLFIYLVYDRYGVVGRHDIIEAEHISLGDDSFSNWFKTNLRLLVTKLQQVEVLE
ncbi:hypothetical protein Hanom_Chr12g01156111 [Helianthus anomalus]